MDEEEIEEIPDLAEEDITEAHSAVDEAWHWPKLSAALGTRYSTSGWKEVSW